MVDAVVTFIKDRRRHAALLFVASLLVASVALFAAITDEVTDGDVLPYDERILTAINQTLSPRFDAVFVIGTDLGGVIAVVLMSAAIGGWLLYRKQRRLAAFFLSSVGGAMALNATLKLLFTRERPELWERLVTESTYSFPSGHAMASSALAFTLIVLLWPTRWRSWVIGLGLFYMAFIGFSRLYLGVHYPTDVLAGWCLSLAWVLAMRIVFLDVLARRKTAATFSRAE